MRTKMASRRKVRYADPEQTVRIKPRFLNLKTFKNLENPILGF